MMNGRVRLEREQPRHAHGAGPTDLAQIVPQQIDNHHVLGEILRARLQFTRELGILRERQSARPRALDRPRFDLARTCVDPQEALGRNARDPHAVVVEVRSEWRRIARSQPPV